MIQRGTLHRSTLVAIALLGVFGLLGYRLYVLQVVRHDELLAKVRGMHERKKIIAPVRGPILDARMNVLAQTVSVWNVAADPELMRPNAADWTAFLASHLGMTQAEIAPRVLKPGRHVLIQKRVDDQTVALLQEDLKRVNARRKKGEQWRGLKLEREYERHYPNGSLASHLIGCTIDDVKQFEGQQVVYHRGVDGIEKYFDREMTGTVGYRKIEKDRRGGEMVAFRGEDVPPINGCQIVLTIDQAIQHIVEEELAGLCAQKNPKSATAVVLRPDTGEVLAMACRPTYDLNDPAKDVDAMRNIVIADAHEPGSTFKTVVVSGALDEGLVRLDESIYCENGKYLYAGYYLHDHKAYGFLTVKQVISLSSNIGAAKIAERLGNWGLYRTVRNFGFGEPTGIQLPGEARGIVHPPGAYSKISITRIAMGHEISATPLQITMAMGAIANGGSLMKPLLVRKILDENGKTISEFTPEVRKRVIERKAAAEMTRALVQVVGPEGTAPQAAIPGWTVAGKTGTAEKIENGRYVKTKNYSSFVGFFPAEKPQICIFVGVDESTDYGGQVAAPVFREIGRRAAAYLGLRPTARDGRYAELSAPTQS